MWFWFENKNNNHDFFLIRRNVRTQSWIIKNKQQATKSENCIFHEVQRQRQRQPQKGRNILDFPMSFTTLLVGGSLGFAAQCSSNAIQKIPISRRKFFLPHMRNWYSFDARLCLCLFCLHYFLPFLLLWIQNTEAFYSLSVLKCAFFPEPWMHLLCTLGGAMAASKWVNVKKELLVDVNEIRGYKGLPPMVGTRSYFPFVPPIEVPDS